MFGIGIGELLLIFVIALLVFGPDKLPQVARTAGKFMRDLKRTSDDIRSSIEREINISELRQTLDLPEEVKRTMKDLVLPPEEVETRRQAKMRELAERRTMADPYAAAGPEPDERRNPEVESVIDGKPENEGKEPAISEGIETKDE